MMDELFPMNRSCPSLQASRILRDTPYFNLNKTYSLSSTPISGLVNFNRAVDDSSYDGRVLSDQDIQNIVVNRLPTGWRERW